MDEFMDFFEHTDPDYIYIADTNENIIRHINRLDGFEVLVLSEGTVFGRKKQKQIFEKVYGSDSPCDQCIRKDKCKHRPNDSHKNQRIKIQRKPKST